MIVKIIFGLTALFLLYFIKEKRLKEAIVSLAIFSVELYVASLFDGKIIKSEAYESTVAPTQTIEASVETIIEEDDYIIPDSDKREITVDDLKELSQWELRIARNEIYARKGRIFKTKELRDYFNRKSWYSGTIEPEDFTKSERKILSEIEFNNAVFIDKYEQSLGYYYD